ncbi:Reticulon-domain-containing protein [Thermoascus aurantiacus ATCC 26904]
MAESSSAGDVSYPVVNGISPVASHIKSEAFRTGNELRDLSYSRTARSMKTATGQPLTHYHSLLYSLLSWERPRATAASFATVVSLIFAARYLPLIRWFFKFLYLALGFTAALEIAGKTILSQGLASSFRPRKYYTIPKDTIEGVLEDLEQLVDFFLIEFQRILFAENIVHTVAAFSAAFISYWLIQILPLWGLALIGVTIAYMGPLVYINNREVIDAQIAHIQNVINTQANQVKDLASQHTAHATDLVKHYVDEYSSKAQEYMGNRRFGSPEMTKASPQIKAEPSPPQPAVKQEDFPEAPKAEPVSETAQEPEPKPEAVLAS